MQLESFCISNALSNFLCYSYFNNLHTQCIQIVFLQSSWICKLYYIPVSFQHYSPPLQLLQQRTWLIHWSLFVFFNHAKGRDLLIDMFLYQPTYVHIFTLTILFLGNFIEFLKGTFQTRVNFHFYKLFRIMIL